MSAKLNVSEMTISITVNDLDRSMRFYVDGLGFTLDEKYEVEGKLMGGTFKAGSAVLGLTQDDFAKGRDRTKGVGFRIYLETKENIEALANQAKDAGIAIDGPAKQPWGPFGFTVVDPDGFKVTITNPE